MKTTNKRTLFCRKVRRSQIPRHNHKARFKEMLILLLILLADFGYCTHENVCPSAIITVSPSSTNPTGVNDTLLPTYLVCEEWYPTCAVVKIDPYEGAAWVTLEFPAVVNLSTILFFHGRWENLIDG